MLRFYLSLLASSLIAPILIKLRLPYPNSPSVSSDRWLQLISISSSSSPPPSVYSSGCTLLSTSSTLTHSSSRSQSNLSSQNTCASLLSASPYSIHLYIDKFAIWFEHFQFSITCRSVLADGTINALFLPSCVFVYFLANMSALLLSHCKSLSLR